MARPSAGRMRICVALLVVVVAAAGRVADPPNYRQLLRKIAGSADMQQYMQDDLGSGPRLAPLDNDMDKTTVRRPTTDQ